MKPQGKDDKLIIGGAEFGITEWSGEIAPATFYFEGKPFEQNANSIYVPAAQIEAAVVSKPTFTVSVPGAFDNLTIAEILNNPAAKAAMEAAKKKAMANMSSIWKSVMDDSVKPEHFYDKFAGNYPPLFGTGSLKKSFEWTKEMLDAASFKQQHTSQWIEPDDGFANYDAMCKQQIVNAMGIPPSMLYGYPVEYGPSPLQGLFKEIFNTAHRRPFTIEHDDSHLFTRQSTKSHTEAWNEQEALRGMHGTNTSYVWSETLGAHVPIC